MQIMQCFIEVRKNDKGIRKGKIVNAGTTLLEV